MIRASRTIPALALVSFLALPAAPASAQTAQEVVEEAVDAYVEQMEGVENYTVVQHQESRPEDKQITYFTRIEGEGDGPIFSVQRVGGMDQETTANPYDLFHVFRERGELRGTETVNGEEAFVLHVDDVRAEDFPGEGPPDMGGGAMQSLTYWVDTDDYLLRRMAMTAGAEGQGAAQGAAQTTVTLDFLDYRDVEGILYPHRIDFDVDSPMMEEMARQMQQMQEAMADVPEEQREQMRAMMDEQMGGGFMGGAMVVDRIRVNEGPPPELSGG